MQRARCYLLGETAVVLELEPPVTLATQKRIWRLTQRLVDLPDVVEAIPGMNNITVVLRSPHTLALDAIERLQRGQFRSGLYLLGKPLKWRARAPHSDRVSRNRREERDALPARQCRARRK